MAAIYLQHPTHGHKVATTDVEARYDRENGWTDWVPPHLQPKSEPIVPSFLTDALSDLPADFPGRNPLIEAGLLTWAIVKTKTRDELLALPGIGEKTADSIVKALDV